uniref:CSON003630 protein n=1 Tax=Culicoides sonorensis TaxID=179676 RepID=A0A336MLY5_CULSO
MVRTYKRKTERAKIDEEANNNAIKDVKETKIPIRQAASKHGIHVNTLRYRLNKIRSLENTSSEQNIINNPQKHIFTVEQAESLASYILKCSKLHFGLTLKQTRRLAFKYAQKLELKIPPSWNKNKHAEIDWLYNFRKRHPSMSLRKPENTSAARSYGFSKHAVNEFYDLLGSVLEQKRFSPTRIFNIDETGISTVMSMPKILANKNQRQVGQFVSAERETFLKGAPLGSLSNKSGWMTGDLFVKVLQHIQSHTNSSKDHPILLLMDNHESHISVNAIEFCRSNGITCLSFTPHTSHNLQPLDVSVYGPFKAKLKTAFSDWHTYNVGKTLTIYNVLELSKLAFYPSFTASNIISGFQKPGISPFNRLAFNDEDFD